ncbi:phosphorylase [Phormidium sp. LEGE 05292]|uniref:ATP adenylyltransferase family protein n=1 Tax=[Phormidium] sp. LEGE 05292 TaxID=767427 RepID=UPI00187EA042|nr:phosphorylase [Phormidium sp. LEGE 05292]MBE9226803.1 phosphorylase [Phormidium sp. LEGE 05292]
MTEAKPMQESSILWRRLVEQTEYALKCGALQSIPTSYEFVEQGRVRFLVRILANLVRKDAAKSPAKKDKDFNPFLPYEEDLFVADISDSHVCLLNKFNVVEHHLLIVTRAFAEQESWLDWADFQAMWLTLAEIDGLAFYNSGAIAGASQRHKHLQLVPLPLVDDGEEMPIAPLLKTAKFEAGIGKIPDLPFVHAIAKFDPSWINSPDVAAEMTLKCYFNLQKAVGLLNDCEKIGDRPNGAYNLLATREWMMIVPRSQEFFQGISINSLGFAGALLVRNQEQKQLLLDTGPLNILTAVAQPWN